MYHKLKLKQITGNNINDKLIDKNLIDSLLHKTILECPFSTFPYFHNNNSKQSLKYSQGNCVSLSLYLQKLLRKEGIKSILIPAGVPNRYKHPGYIDISHCALVVLESSGNIFLCDPAFYFNESLMINPFSLNNNNINSTNIYDNEVQNINFELKTTLDSLNLNEFQMIPLNTNYISASFKEDPYDSWNYYLTNVINPDKAISTYFINLKNLPFITILDNKYKLIFLMKFITNDKIIIKKYGKEIYNGLKNNIPEKIKLVISEFLGNDWEKFYLHPNLKTHYNFNDSIKKKRKIKKTKKSN